MKRALSGLGWAATGTIALALGLLATPWVATGQPTPKNAEDGMRQTLRQPARPIAYTIAVVPDFKARTFAGEARIEFEASAPLPALELNAADLSIAQARIDGQGPITVSMDADLERARFTFAKALAAERHTLHVSYSGKLYDTTSGLFVVEYGPPEARQQMLASQFEPVDARRLAPIWDEPAHKAVFNLEIVAPAGMEAISNMPVRSVTPADNGARRFVFEPSPKMSSYLMYLGVGTFDRITADGSGVKQGIIAAEGDATKGRYALDASQKILAYFEDYFGLDYPLPKLDHIAVPFEGGFGAMENWGAILYQSDNLLFDPSVQGEAARQDIFDTVAHETAHQWFGNIVTMAWWDDLWLNEGFASWMASKTTDRFNPDWDKWLQVQGGSDIAMELDARASTHPIVQEVNTGAQANQAFDTITYLKGQAVIRMIEDHLGENTFRKGVRAYMKRHAYGNTRTSDLWSALARASGQPVQAIAADFTTQPGVPLIRVSTARCRKGKTTVTLQQARFDADNSGQKPLKWHTPIALQVAGKPATTRRVVLSGRSTVTLAGCGAIKVNAGQRGYYRTQYDQAARTALEAAFKSLPPADQLGLLHDTWAFGATGVAPLADYMRLAGQAGPAANPVVTAQVAGGLRELGRLANGTPLEQPIALRARQILAPAFARVGWDVKPGEPANDAVLRETLIRTLALHADPAVRAEAKRRMAAGELPGATRSATLHAALYGADVALYEATLKKADATSNPVEKRQLYGAISAALDPALAKRTLKMALDPSSGTLGPWLISSVARSHPDLAWVAVTENWGQLAEQLDPLQRYDFAASIAAFSPRAERATELEAFAAANLPADARKAAVEAAAAIRADATIRDRYLPELAPMLAASQ